MNINAAVNTFLEYQEAKGNSDKTILYYRSNLERFVHYVGDIDIKEINIDILRTYIKHLQDKVRHENNAFISDDKKRGKISSTSVQTYVRSIRAFLSWLFNDLVNIT